MPPEPPISERCAIVGLAHTEADEEPALVVVHTPFLGLGAGHARQVGLPADVIDQYRAAPAGLLLVACAHHGRALAGMVQEHDRAPGIGGDGLHATDDLGHGAAGVFFLDVEPAQRVQHHQAAALGGALEAVEPLRGHDVGQAADQRLDQQAVSHGLPFLGAEVRPKGVQAVMNGGGRVFGGQDFIHVAGILAFALDVVGLGPGRLAARPAAGFRRKVINRHAASLLLLLFGSMQWPSESAPPEGWPLGQFLEEKPVSAPSPYKVGSGLPPLCLHDSLRDSTLTMGCQDG